MKRALALALALAQALGLAACGPGDDPPTAGELAQPVQRDVQATVVYQQGVLPDATYQHAGADVWAYEPDANYAHDALWLMGRNGNFGWPYLHFDLQGLVPAEAAVLGATVELYCEAAYSYGYSYYQTAAAHRVLSAWTEAGLTYNTKPPDWNDGLYESSVFVDGAARWFSFDVTQMASAWVADPASNFGLAILPIDSLYDGDFIVWRSDDHASAAHRPRLSITYLLPEHRAAFLGHAPPPASLGIGQQVSVQVIFRNDGADTWTDGAGYGLGSEGPADNTTWGMSRVALPGPVGPGEQAVFDFQATAPPTPGDYLFQWRMVHDGVQWFGDPSPAVPVTVSLLADSQPCTDPGQCQSGLCVDGYCCDSACVGPCRTCARPDRPGLCSYVLSGQDPDGECPGDGPCGASCNGAGACAAPPAAGLPCATCASCDGAGACVPAAAGADPHEDCPAEPAASCGRTGACDGAGACAFFPADLECAPEACAQDVHHAADRCDGAGSCVDGGAQPCSPYVCLDAVQCRTGCSLDEHCVADSRCELGACIAYLDPGQACGQDAQCRSGVCADGVCCLTPCAGACQRCDLAASPGTCAPLPDGQDPDGECPGTGLCGGVCDGQGACRFTAPGTRCGTCVACDGAGACGAFDPPGTDPHDDCAPCWGCSGSDASCRAVAEGVDALGDCPDGPPEACGPQGACDGAGSCRLWPAGTPCRPAGCADGVLSPADLCDGQGACLDSGEVFCAPFACLSDEACREACAADEDCLAGHYCEAPGCQPLRAQGEPCARGGECWSGACADGVCCDEACEGSCLRCDRAGLAGTCGPVPDGEDPDAECGGEGVCGGACDGAGACRVPGPETACGACVRCDGQGACAQWVPAGQDPDDACGPCRVCAGDRDACLPVPASEDPLEECAAAEPSSCGPDGACDGAGACRLWPLGTVCGPQRCVGDQLERPPACDGAGICRLQEALSCAPYGCDGDWCAGPAGLARISIEDAAEGGQEVGDRALTTDERLGLFAIGRDSQDAALGLVVVSWSVTGGVGTASPSPSGAADFDPTRPGLGRVQAAFHDPAVQAGETGLLTVSPGLPVGPLPLEPAERLLPADGESSTEVRAGPARDADGNLVADGTPFTVLTSLGELLAEDADPAAPGLQRPTLDGLFAFRLRAAAAPGRARLRAFAAPPAAAEGLAEVFFGDGRPVADAGPDLLAAPGARVQLDGTASWDPGGMPLAFTWTQTAGPAVALDGASGPTPAFEAPGVGGPLAFDLVVRAGGQDSAPDEVRVQVQGADPDQPLAALRLEPAEGLAPLAVALDGRASRAADCCRLVGHVWTFSDDHPPLAGEEATRTFAAPGGVGVTLSVVDDQGRFDAASGQVSVLDGAGGAPPRLALHATPGRGPAPLEVALRAEAEDPEGGAVALEWDLGGGFVPGPAGRTWRLAEPGHHRARVRATDPDGLQATASAVVAVSLDGLYPPRILSSPPAQAALGEAFSYAPLAAGSRPLAWSLGKEIGGQLVRAPAGMQVDEESGALTWTPAASQLGPVEVSLVVRNAAGADLQDFTLSVAGEPPAGGCGCGATPGPGWSLAALAALGALARRRRGSGR